MPASEAQVAANRRNAKKSTGPKTDEGKEQSRANALKHGLTGAGIVLPERAKIEVQRRVVAFAEELKPEGEVGYALVRRAAVLSVRLEACEEHQTAVQTDRVRRVLAEFEAPEGVDPATLARLRSEVEKQAMFDPSDEASLARRYEAAAERGFFRALKELRLLATQAKAEASGLDPEADREELGSILPGDMTDDEFDALYARFERETGSSRPPSAETGRNPTPRSPVDVPIAVGRAR